MSTDLTPTPQIPAIFPDVPLERYWIPQNILFTYPNADDMYRLLGYAKLPRTYQTAMLSSDQPVTILATDTGELIVVPSVHLPGYRTRQTSPTRVGYRMPEGYFEILCEGLYRQISPYSDDLGFQGVSSFGSQGIQRLMLYQNTRTGEYCVTTPCLSQMHSPVY